MQSNSLSECLLGYQLPKSPGPSLCWVGRKGEGAVGEQREGPSISVFQQHKPQAAFLTFCLERTLENAGGIRAPSLRDPTPVCRLSAVKEGGPWGPGGLGHGKQLRPPPPVSFPRLGSFPCRTSITQDGLAEPIHSSLGMWAGPPLRLVWGCSLQLGATVLLSSQAVPRGTFNSTRCLEAEGWGSARSNQ